MTRTQALASTLALLAAAGGGILLGQRLRPDGPASSAVPPPAAPGKPLYYRNPMGLPDTSPVPKKDAMGMDYIPVHAHDEVPRAPGTVVLSPGKVQTLGVRTEPVRAESLAMVIEGSGTVTVDETRQHIIAPRFDGWVEILHANQSGMMVRRGQPLATVYSPQLLAAQQEYRVADAALRQMAQGDTASRAAMARLRDAARRRLQNWQIGASQLRHLAHQPPGNLTITAPTDGVVVGPAPVQGMRFVAGDTLLRLVDLSTVWITVSVPEAQSGSVRVGQAARFRARALPVRTFEGRVAFLQPMLDPSTRTLGVRIEMKNPDGQLRPGLFGSVVLSDDAGTPALTVPRSAVIDSGARQIALVEVAPGRYAPRRITLGRRSGGRVEVLDGLREGERVVVEGNFLIDAESNLRAALQDMAPARATSHSGHDMGSHDMPAASRTHADPHAGHTMPAAAPTKPAATDPHAGHGMPDKPKADPHAGHDMPDMEH